MSNMHFNQQAYKSLLPIPKTHLFMKKIARIQAIDRQMRKKWIKIKRDNQLIKSLSNIQNHTFTPLKNNIVNDQSQISFSPSKNLSHITTLQNCLKRQKIIGNHKKNEQIFYGRKKKGYAITEKSKEIQNEQYYNGVNTFFANRRRIKTQVEEKHKQDYKLSYRKIDRKRNACSQTNQVSSRQYLSSPKSDCSKESKNFSKKQVSLPFMLLRRGKNKDRQKDIISIKSEQQLIELSHKKEYDIKQWASQKKGLFQKLKGSKAYYIMKNPTLLDQSQNVYLY